MRVSREKEVRLMDDQFGHQSKSALEDFMANGFPMLFYILFPGFMLGYYFSIPLGFLGAFVGFFLFRLHCHLLDIKIRLDEIIENMSDRRL